MAVNETTPAPLSPDAYCAAILDPERRRDCQALAGLMAAASRQDARMGGPAIVGFGTHRYALAGGKVGEICAVGFSPHTGAISMYGVAGEEADPALLRMLGKHTRGKGCLYVSRLADVDLTILEWLIAGAVERRQASP